jgi:penicillin-binding protein 2
VLALRLAFLQLLHGGTYRRLAEQNRLRLVPQLAPRGLILDRQGRPLAANRIVFRLAAVPQDLPALPVWARLGPLVNVAPRELERRFNEQRTLPFLPATLVSRVSKSVALRVEEERVRLPGVLIEPVTVRQYPVGPAAAHLIGYLSQPSPEAFPVLKQYGVRPKDLVGRAGIEQALDAYLRGQSGGSLVEVDHQARQIRVVGHREPIPGQSITLTIDAALSALIGQRFGEATGACVVLRPQTGEALAMVSVPGFEPEFFATQDAVRIQRLFADPGAPLLSRATNGAYLPGSIVKPVTAMTALEHRLISPATTVTCPGYLAIGNRRFHCWNRDGHGTVTLHEALMLSCNVYFMQIGRRLGLDRLRAGFSSAGFGRRTGWPMGEQSGRLPFGRRLSEGEVALLAMGQGEILVTPLQAAAMASAIANGGWLMEPWVVKTVAGHAAARSHGVALGWSDEHLSVVRAGMAAVVNAPQGTGARASSAQVRIAGKTGTAQTNLPGRPHGWFVGFCPAEDPLAAIAIVAEHGGSGGELPAAMAKAICEYVVAQDVGSPG